MADRFTRSEFVRSNVVCGHYCFDSFENVDEYLLERLDGYLPDPEPDATGSESDTVTMDDETDTLRATQSRRNDRFGDAAAVLTAERLVNRRFWRTNLR